MAINSIIYPTLLRVILVAMKAEFKFGKKLTYAVGMSFGHQEDNTNCLGNEGTVTWGFIHVVASWK